MRFYTIRTGGREKIAAEKAGRLKTLAAMGFGFSDMNELIENYSPDLERAILKNFGDMADSIALSDAVLDAPIVRPKQDVICLGINYDEHAAESARFSKESFGGERPYTIYFSKRVSRATGDGAVIPFYEGLVDGLDYEAELGVIIGRAAKNVSYDETKEYIFGYTVINDVSARNLQMNHKQWYRGKSLDGFTPIGPCIVTKDEIADVHALSIKSFVNGELRQNSNTRFMIQNVYAAIAELSQGMTLEAGTIIATGTPSGVGMGFVPPRFLMRGDRVRCEIEGIGSITNEVG
jgi:2-keto-4-pentenoate hydratase/2-oxohepta-3-ene-1,7-dioic acid hydratase in catechol pathway